MADPWNRRTPSWGMPVFRGKFGEDPDEHLMSFEKFCFATSKGGTELFPKRFLGSLAGGAEDWFRSLGDEQKESWESISKAFIVRFRSQRFKLDCLEKLHAAKQKSNECVSEYSDRVRRLARLLEMKSPQQSQEVKDFWLRGLRREFYSTELTVADSTFKDCVRLAENQESRLDSGESSDLLPGELARQLHELRSDMAKMRRGGDEFGDPGYRGTPFRPPPGNVCSLDEDEIVANIQTGMAPPWAYPGGQFNGPAGLCITF